MGERVPACMVRAGAGIRCDGVVEYCYEWNNFRVFGWDAWWDISSPGCATYHCLPGAMDVNVTPGITPKIQANGYLTWLGNIEPT